MSSSDLHEDDSEEIARCLNELAEKVGQMNIQGSIRIKVEWTPYKVPDLPMRDNDRSIRDGRCVSYTKHDQRCSRQTHHADTDYCWQHQL